MTKGIVVRQITACFRFGVICVFQHMTLNYQGQKKFFASLKLLLALKQEARKGTCHLYKFREPSKHQF